MSSDEQPSVFISNESANQGPYDQPAQSPTREELQGELLDVPNPVEQPKAVDSPTVDKVLATALRHVRGTRGGDLLAVILVGSGARRALTRHSDLDLIVIIKGDEEREEVIRIADRVVEIRYRGQKAVELELPYTPRLPPLLRKGRVLFEHEAAGTKLIEIAAQRFRQGPPPASLNERIRLKSQCVHWLGKAEDLQGQPASAQYLLGIFVDDFVHAFFRMRGLWLTSPADALRFVTSRDDQVGDVLGRFMTATTLPERLNLGHQLTDLLFSDVPNPSRID